MSALYLRVDHNLAVSLSTATLAALCCLPFLVPIHTLPIPSFHSEWVAATLAVILISLSASRLSWQSMDLPAITGVAATILVVVLVQRAIGIGHFAQQTLIHASYLTLVLALMVAGREIVSAMGPKQLVFAMATGFSFGALFQCAAVLCQIQDWNIPGWTTPLSLGRGVFGNLAQPNHLTHYLWLGVISLIYLRAEQRVSAPLFLVSICAVGVASAYTGSRSATLYPLAIIALFSWTSHRLDAPESALRLRRTSNLACIFALIALALPQVLPLPQSGVASTGLIRLVASAVEPSTAGIRVQLIETAARSVSTAPWFGHGVGSVPRQSLLNGPDRPGTAFGVAEHFHNIFANWAVEFGVLVTAVAIVMLIGWVVRVTACPWQIEKIWALGVLLMSALHSLLEYPLWYSFFLAPVALLLGALDTKYYVVTISRLSRIAMAVGGIFACFLLFNLWNDHSRLAQIYRLPPSGPQAEAIWKGQVDTLLELHKESLFSPLINGMLIVTADINEERVENKVRVCNDALHYSPTPRIIFKCASLMMIAGHVDEGFSLAAMGKRSFPHEAGLAGVELQVLSVRFPVLVALRDLLAPIAHPATATSDQ